MKKSLILGLLTWLLMSSCAHKITRLEQYPKMYEEKPLSIAVMPPINQTKFVEAKEYFYTTLHAPLCEKGYYVYSPMMTMELFESESAYDAEDFLEADLSQFRNVLGADACMFTIIKKWKRNKFFGHLEVGVECILRSTRTGETLFRRETTAIVDTGVTAFRNTIPLFGILIDYALTAIKTSATDKVVAGRACAVQVISDMPEGKYGTKFDKDQEERAYKSQAIKTKDK